jgi:hypothetical protein
VRKSIFFSFCLAVLACTGGYYLLSMPDAIPKKTSSAAAQEVKAADASSSDGAQIRLVEALAPQETIRQAQIQTADGQEAICITAGAAGYVLTGTAQSAVLQAAFDKYIGGVFEMRALRREYGALETDEVETSIEIRTDRRTIVLRASAPKDGECIVERPETEEIYRVRAQDVVWRGACVPALTGWLIEGRSVEEVEKFYMNTPDTTYHFIRTQDGTHAEDENAEGEAWEWLLEMLFTWPVEAEPAYAGGQGEWSLSLTYSDGGESHLTIAPQNDLAYLRMDDGTTLTTDVWRVHALLLACDGVRVESDGL